MSGSWTGKTDEYLAVVIANTAFFPDLTLGDLQRDYRMPAEYAQETVEEHLRIAMLDVNEALEDQQVVWEAAGATTLAEATTKTIGNENVFEMRYRRAVFAKTKALLLQQFATMVRKDSAENLAREGDDTQQHWLSVSKRNVDKLKGKSSGYTVELL